MAIQPAIRWLRTPSLSGFGTNKALDEYGIHNGTLFNITPDGVPLPAWITDAPTGVGLEFNGTHGLSTSFEHQWVYGDPAAALQQYTAYGIGGRFRTRPASTKGGPVISLGDNSLSITTTYSRDLLKIYLRTDGRVVLRVQISSLVTGYDVRYITSAASFNDGEWHDALGVYCNGTSFLYVDGQLIGSVVANQYLHTTKLFRLQLGNYSLLAPGTNTIPEDGCSSAMSTFDGALCDARYYPDTCLTPDEEEPIPTEPPEHTIYIGHCPAINETNLCLTRSNSRCRTGGSTTPVIIR